MNTTQAMGANVYAMRDCCNDNVSSCFGIKFTPPHWRFTSQDMTLRCDMAAHLGAGKEYDLSTLVMNANGNAAKCKQLFATCPCGKPEVLLFGGLGETPNTRFYFHNNPAGYACEYGGWKVKHAVADAELFAQPANPNAFDIRLKK